MPELPEVHTITQDLTDHIVGTHIKNVVVSENYKQISPDSKSFIENVSGRKILNVSRVAKNIIIELDSGDYVRMHLAMTGRVLLRDKKGINDSWVKVVFRLSKNDKDYSLRFADMRMFGKVSLLNIEELNKLRQKYGPEPIDQNLSAQKFAQILTSKKTNIKNALLDQKLVSGLGNIYATDALFLAGIHPETDTKDISETMAEKLLSGAREVLFEGMKNRGSTLPDKMYVDIFGKEGHHQEHFKIYLKKRCPSCNGPVEFKKIAGRGTYYCPTCQVRGQQQRLI